MAYIQFSYVCVWGGGLNHNMHMFIEVLYVQRNKLY